MAHAARLGALILAGLLGGCGALPSGERLRAMLPGTEAAEPPAPAVAGPALLLAGPRRATLVPAGGAAPRRIWRAENLAIETEGARVVATAGLPRQVMFTRFEGRDPLEDPRALVGRPAPARRLVDLADASRDPAAMRFGVMLDCMLEARLEGAAILVEERCVAGELRFTNRFWARPETGLVERSEQWAGEGMPPLQLRVAP